MPEHHHKTYKKNGHVRTQVTLVKGESISLCRCWQSKKFPLCDGSHNSLDNDRDPAIIHVDCDQNFHDEDLRQAHPQD